MLARRTLLGALAVVNVALVCALLMTRFSLPPAFARAGLSSGQFITATAKAQGQSYDVLYVVDLTDHRLHAFYPSIASSKRLTHAPSRDLYRDFAKEQGP